MYHDTGSSARPPKDQANGKAGIPDPVDPLAFGQPVFRDESLAPQVDLDLLRALVRRELADETTRSVYRLIHSFRSWNDAHTQIMIDEFRRQQHASPESHGE
jgi:hypothetical protein